MSNYDNAKVVDFCFNVTYDEQDLLDFFHAAVCMIQGSYERRISSPVRKTVASFLEQFNAMTKWEQANVMYRISGDIKHTAVAYSKYLSRQARKLDIEQVA